MDWIITILQVSLVASLLFFVYCLVDYVVFCLMETFKKG